MAANACSFVSYLMKAQPAGRKKKAKLIDNIQLRTWDDKLSKPSDAYNSIDK